MFCALSNLIFILGSPNRITPEGGRLKRRKGNLLQMDKTQEFHYRAIHPVSRKVLKMMFSEIPPADWLILQLPTAQAGPHNSCGKT